jgi:hypothetical protein
MRVHFVFLNGNRREAREVLKRKSKKGKKKKKKEVAYIGFLCSSSRNG